MESRYFSSLSAVEKKKEILLKLLRIEADTLDNLGRTTGWNKEDTQMVLLQLVVDGKVKCRNANGRRVYFAVPKNHFHKREN